MVKECKIETVKKKLKISEDDLKIIHGNDYKFFVEKIIPNCWCSKCRDKNSSTIVNYGIFLNDINDIELKGFCKRCGSRIGRYIETGEVERYLERIEEVREKLT